MGRESQGISPQEMLIQERSPFIGKQARLLQERLDILHLQGVSISSVPEVRDASFFRRKPVMAMSGGFHQDSLALLIALSTVTSAEPEAPFIPLVVSLTPQGSGLLVDESNRTIKTDSFWVYEDDMIKYIIPSEPITIDALNPDFDSPREDPVLDAFLAPHERLFALSNNKLTTKTILQQAGIAVPRGITIEAHEESEVVVGKIRDFIQTLPSGSGFVLKELEGAHGIGVGLFPWEDMDNVIAIAEGFSEEGETVLFEERIKPRPLTTAQKEKLGFTADQEVDYNFRVLVSLDPENPKAIDAEMRYRKYSFAPVNITYLEKPASAVRVDILDDPDLVQRINTTAEQATRVLCQAALVDGGTITGTAGVDVIIGEDGEIIPVLEVNTRGAGGFATLTRLDGKPLSSVTTKLGPEWSQLLNYRYTQRQPETSTKLRRLPHNNEDMLELYRSDLIDGNFSHAQAVLLAVGHNYHDQYYIMNSLLFIAEQLGDFTHFEQYLDEILARNKSDRLSANAMMFKYKISRHGQGDSIVVDFTRE